MSVSEYNDPTGFAMSVSTRENGTLEAAYVRISQNQVARTEELVESVLLVDFDHNEDVAGIEILAPITVSQVVAVASRLDASQRTAFENFVRSSAPPGLVNP